MSTTQTANKIGMNDLSQTSSTRRSPRLVKSSENSKARSLTLGNSAAAQISAFAALAIAALAWAIPILFALQMSFKKETDASAAPLQFWPSQG